MSIATKYRPGFIGPKDKSKLDNISLEPSEIVGIEPTLDLDFSSADSVPSYVEFTRGTIGTYYDANTTAKAEENLLTYSEEFTSANIWTGYQVIREHNVEIAPDGSMTADKITKDGDGYVTKAEAVPLVSGYRRSIYAKVASGTATVSLLGHNLATGTLFTLTDEWQRFDLEVTDGVFKENFYAVDFRHPSATATEVYVWGAQLEKRDSVTAYTPTQASPITNYIPVLKTAQAHEPRIDHDPITREVKGLLCEHVITNLIPYSEDFNNSAWSKNRGLFQNNILTAPNGTISADKFIPNTVDNVHFFDETFTNATNIAIGTYYTFSIYVKSAGYTIFSLDNYYAINGPSGVRTVFNLAENGSIIEQQAERAKIEPVGNGWFRCSVTVITDILDTRLLCRVTVRNEAGQGFAGDGYSGIYFWGAQLETSPFATSYIPTNGSSEIRQKDLCQITGQAFKDWFYHKESTLYCDHSYYADKQGANQFTWEIAGDTGGLVWFMNGNASSNNIANKIKTNPTLSTSPILEFFGRRKLVASYSVFEQVHKIAFNGDLRKHEQLTDYPVDTDMMLLDLGGSRTSYYMFGHIKRVTYWPKLLSDEALIELTKS